MLKKIVKWIGLAFLALNVLTLLSGNRFIYKAIYYNFVNIDDYKIFDNRSIPASKTPKPWSISTAYNKKPLTDSLVATLEKYKSVAFLVIKNDSLIAEKYWKGYGEKSISNSFSMAKSVVSMLVGAAIKDGYIKSVNQPVADFLPEFKEGEKVKITIKHLLQMSSGLDFDESKSYKNPVSVFFSDIMVAYYGSDLYQLVATKSPVEAPGVYFDYKSGDTQLLAFIVMKAVNKNLSEYFYEKIWNPIGAETEALWCLDRENGFEKAFCCINSNARDFARLGKLYLNKGNAFGLQVVDTSYVEASINGSGLIDKLDTTKICDFYGYQWWMMPNYKEQNIFYLRGTLGQMVIVIPEKNIIIVRLGEEQGPKQGSHYAQIYSLVDEVNTMY